MKIEIKPEQVPEAAADAARELGVSRWVARDIVAAVLNAWPGMRKSGFVDGDGTEFFILPLTAQEPGDESV